MSRCLPLLSILLASALWAADPGEKLEDWSYSVAAAPLSEQYVDPGNRLTDGETGRGSVAIWRAGDVTVDIALPQPVALSGVRVHQHRHNLNYKLDHLALLVRRGGQWEEVARRPGFLGPTEAMDFVHEFELDDVTTDALQLVFNGVGVLSLSEVELFGARPAAVAAGGAFADVPLRAEPGARAREEDLDGDGQVEVILENERMRLIFAPAQGGVVRSLRLKPENVELIGAAGGGYGLLRDQLWKPAYSFGERFYFHRLDNRDGEASVELWASGVGGMMSFTEMRKRITLADGADVARVRYTLTNEPSSQTDYEYGFWSHNWTGQPGVANTYFYPTTSGVQSFRFEPGAEKGKENWYREPARGWTAVVSENGYGLAMAMPYRYLNLLYSWYGTGSLAATHEWRLNLLEVKAGQSLQFDVDLIALRDVEAVDGVVDGVVGDLAAAADGGTVQATATLLQPAGGAGGHTVRWSLVSADGAPAGAAEPVALAPGERAEATARWDGLTPGLYVARAEVLGGDGQVRGAIEQPVTVGDGRFAYRLEPEGEQVGRREEAAAKPGHVISTEVQTPHIPWARPLAGGPLKALVLMDDLNSREAVELAQRLEMQLDYVKFRTTRDKELLYQGDLSILTLDSAQKALQAKLEENHYDLFVLAGFDWSLHFTAENRQAIFDQVRKGAGLLLVQPDGFTAEMAAELPVAGVAKEGSAAKPMHGYHAWSPAGEHPLAAALDWSRYPVTRRHEYDAPPAGEVVATIGDDAQPLITLGSLGEGRVVSTTWDVLTHVASYRGYSALTPILSYRGGWLRPEFAELPHGYHENWFALLTRLATWAAGRDTGGALTAAPRVEGAVKADASDAEVAVTFTLSQPLPGARMEVWVQPPHTKAPVQTAVELGDRAAGDHTVTVPIEGQAGDNTVSLILRGADGAAHAWGFTTASLTAPADIASAALAPDTLLPEGGVWQQDTAVETRAFRPDEPLTASATLTAPAAEPVEVGFSLYDSRGRLLAWRSATVPAGESEARVTFQPPTLVHQGLELVATVGPRWEPTDTARARAVAYRPRVWDRFWYTSWSGNWLWRSQWLFDELTPRVADWGLDVALEGEVEFDTGRVRDQNYWDIGHSWLGMLLHLGQGVPSFPDDQFAEKASQYAKTQDPQYLVREPSLADAAWRDAVAAKVKERAAKAMVYGGSYDYCMGDEMSLTHYTRFHDFDWSPASLAAFRDWLRTRYADLPALNAAWGTDYAAWDAVMPMTREQAQAADNPAPWAEFRLYMNHQLADFYRFVEASIREVDPAAKAGLSGTQSPEAANGMEWWKLSDAFSYYHSYNTSWSNEMRRSFNRYTGGDQSPYNSGYSAVDPDAEYRMWWCLLHDTRGISAWKTGLFFYGDFSLTPSGADTKAHLDTFRNGVWRLLREAERQHDGVAIYYSMPTIVAGALTGQEAAINGARDAWVRIIEDLGLQYEFVSPELVTDGVLADYKVVVLPYTLALSAAEADALRQFVAAGGTLVATRTVGVRDELSRPQGDGLLADLFGVATEGAEEAVEPQVTLTQAFAGLDAGTVVRLPVAHSNLKTTSGEPLATAGAGVPVLVRGAGGRAVTLNLDLLHFEQERRFHSPAEAQLKAIVGGLLADAGVRPPYPVTLQSGKPSQVEVVRYRLGEVEYVALLNAANEADVATLDLGAERHVYDVRAESDRGALTSLQVPLAPLGARIYALSPGPLPAPTLSAPDGAPRLLEAGDDFERPGAIPLTVARAAGGTPQLVRLDVVEPTGRAREDLQQTVWLTDGPVETNIPLALNDPTGTWSVKATDVTSGQTAEVGVLVE